MHAHSCTLAPTFACTPALTPTKWTCQDADTQTYKRTLLRAYRFTCQHTRNGTPTRMSRRQAQPPHAMHIHSRGAHASLPVHKLFELARDVLTRLCGCAGLHDSRRVLLGRRGAGDEQASYSTSRSGARQARVARISWPCRGVKLRSLADGDLAHRLHVLRSGASAH
eukprot:4275433-Pleurochrysis_carterae.AAC.1